MLIFVQRSQNVTPNFQKSYDIPPKTGVMSIFVRCVISGPRIFKNPMNFCPKKFCAGANGRTHGRTAIPF